MINATRKVKEKAEPELREAVKRGANWRARCRQSGRSAARATKGHCRIAKTKKSRERGHRRGEERGCALTVMEDLRVALRRAWEKATALRRLWKEADNGSREWLVEVVWSDLNKGDDSKRAR